MKHPFLACYTHQELKESSLQLHVRLFVIGIMVVQVISKSVVYVMRAVFVAAKNLVLAGVKSVTLHDDGVVELWDLSSNFFFSEADIGKNRALACVQKLQELNNAVVISTLTTELTKEQLSDFQVLFPFRLC